MVKSHLFKPLGFRSFFYQTLVLKIGLKYMIDASKHCWHLLFNSTQTTQLKYTSTKVLNHSNTETCLLAEALPIQSNTLIIIYIKMSSHVWCNKEPRPRFSACIFGFLWDVRRDHAMHRWRVQPRRPARRRGRGRRGRHCLLLGRWATVLSHMALEQWFPSWSHCSPATSEVSEATSNMTCLQWRNVQFHAGLLATKLGSLGKLGVHVSTCSTRICQHVLLRSPWLNEVFSPNTMQWTGDHRGSHPQTHFSPSPPLGQSLAGKLAPSPRQDWLMIINN